MEQKIFIIKKTKNLWIKNLYQDYYLSGDINKYTYLKYLNLEGIVNTNHNLSHIHWKISFHLDSKRDQLLLFKNSQYYPKSFLLPEDLNIIDKNKKYFFKEEKSSSGTGIYLEFNKQVGLAQESIEPFLYNNKKIDNRVYVIIGKINNNNFCYVYKDVLVRSSQNFYLETSKNKLTQITNTAVHNMESMKFNQFILNNLPFYNLFFNKIILVIHDIFNIIISKYTINNNSFNLYGFDIIIDKFANPFLLEINSNPNFIKSQNTQEIIQSKMNLLQDIVYKLIPAIITNNTNNDDINNKFYKIL